MKITKDNLVKLENEPIELFYQGIRSEQTKTSYTRKLYKVLCEYLEDVLNGSFEERAAQLIHFEKKDPRKFLEYHTCILYWNNRIIPKFYDFRLQNDLFLCK